MLENVWSQSWCLYEKYHFLYPKFSISPSRCSMAQVKPYIGLIYMKNATFSYHQCLWNVRGSSFVSGGHSLGPKWDGLRGGGKYTQVISILQSSLRRSLRGISETVLKPVSHGLSRVKSTIFLRDMVHELYIWKKNIQYYRFCIYFLSHKKIRVGPSKKSPSCI